MKRINAFGAMVAVSVSLLAGCSSDSEDTNALVGTWFEEEDDGYFLFTFRADGTCLVEDGLSRDTLEETDSCTYEADASTLTFLTSDVCAGSTGKATYTYTVTNDQLKLTNTSGDDTCTTRKTGLEEMVFTRGSEPVSPSAS